MERQDPVIEQIGGYDWRLNGVELGVSHLAIGVDISLLPLVTLLRNALTGNG